MPAIKKKTPALPPAPADPATIARPITSVDEWRKTKSRTDWWAGVLAHPFGRELRDIVTEFSPEIPTGDNMDGQQAAIIIASTHKQTEGSLLGMIAGHNRLRNLLFRHLPVHVAKPERIRNNPGSKDIEPHPAP